VALARDAVSAGDRVAAETYYQYSEHYFRIVNASTDPEPAERRQAPRNGGNGHAADDSLDVQGEGPGSRQRPAAQTRGPARGGERAPSADGQRQGQGRRRARPERANDDVALKAREAGNGGAHAGNAQPDNGAAREPAGTASDIPETGDKTAGNEEPAGT